MQRKPKLKCSGMSGNMLYIYDIGSFLFAWYIFGNIFCKALLFNKKNELFSACSAIVQYTCTLKISIPVKLSGIEQGSVKVMCSLI